MNTLSKPAAAKFRQAFVDGSAEFGFVTTTRWAEGQELVTTLLIDLHLVENKLASSENPLDALLRVVVETAVELSLGLTVQRSRHPDSNGRAEVAITLDSQENLDDLSKSGMIDAYYTQLVERMTDEAKRQRRPKRSREELPDPSKPPSASVNTDPLRRTFQVATRVSQETIDKIDALKAHQGLTKRQVIEKAVDLFAEQVGLDGGPE